MMLLLIVKRGRGGWGWTRRIEGGGAGVAGIVGWVKVEKRCGWCRG